MDSSTLLEATLKRTLQMACTAAENGEIINSRHFGRQMRSILLECRAAGLSLPGDDSATILPLRNRRVRKFFHKRISRKGRQEEVKKIVFPDLYEISQLFCPFCWVYLTARSTLGTLADYQSTRSDPQEISDRDDGTRTEEGSVVDLEEESVLQIFYFCKPCGSRLPDYQFRSQLSRG